MAFCLFILLAVSGSYAFGQSSDALISSQLLQQDKASLGKHTELHSIRLSHDSLMLATTQTGILESKLDCLHNLRQPVDRLVLQIDSIEMWKNGRIQALKENLERLKSQIAEETNTLKLPDGLENEGKLSDLIYSLDFSEPDSEISLDDAWQTDLSGLRNAAGSGSINIADTDLDVVTEQINEYQGQLNGIPSDMEEASVLAEEQAMGIPEVSEATSQLSEAGKVTEMTGSLRDQQAIKDELVNRAQQQVIDHFQGKEEQLQQAMEMVAKYKKKYGSFQSLEEIAQRKGNPLRGTPFIERFIPGISIQIHRRDTWMADFNLYAAYRLYPRFLAGGGWNQRVAYDPDECDFKPGLRIFGPRVFGELRIGEGFSARLEAEYMNTRVPPQFSSRNADQHGREWVFTSVAGMKKEFRFFKNIKGTMLLLYNLHDPHHRSPYVDKLITRVGFEFPMKKKSSRVQD